MPPKRGEKPFRRLSEVKGYHMRNEGPFRHASEVKGPSYAARSLLGASAYEVFNIPLLQPDSSCLPLQSTTSFKFSWAEDGVHYNRLLARFNSFFAPFIILVKRSSTLGISEMMLEIWPPLINPLSSFPRIAPSL